MELSGRPRDPSGVLQGSFWEHFGPFLGCFWSIDCVCSGSNNPAMFWPLSELFFDIFPDFPKMAEIAPNWELPMNLQLFFSRSSLRFSWNLGKTVSEKGRNLDGIPLEISEKHVKKVCFCGERPLDLNLVDSGRPGSSVGELFGPSQEGD